MPQEKQEDGISEYRFTLGGKEFSVRNEGELALVFETYRGNDDISSLIHWNIIMELDDRLLALIRTYSGLFACLKHLDEKNAYLLLVKISDKLHSIFKDSSQLGEILARMPKDVNKVRILKQMRTRGLTRLVRDPKDFLNIIEWVFDASEREIMDILGDDFLRGLFHYPSEIYDVLHYLNDENKDHLIDLIGLDEVRAKIRNSDDFLLILKGLSYAKAEEFLTPYPKAEIKRMFASDREFRSFLFRLSDRKEDIFLTHLGITNRSHAD